MIIERNDGEDVEVRSLTNQELDDLNQQSDGGAELLKTFSPTAKKAAEGVKHEGETLRDRLSPTLQKLHLAPKKDEDGRTRSPSPAHSKASKASHRAESRQQERQRHEGDEGEWTEDEGHHDAHEAESAASSRPRPRSRSPRLFGRHRAGSRASQTSPRGSRKSRSPSTKERNAPDTSSSTPPDADETATPDEETGRSRTLHRQGAGLLLPPGHGIGFGTGGHYSRSSSPSRSIRFAESLRPNRPAETAAPASGRVKRRSRLAFGSSKKGDGGSNIH